MTKTIYFIMDEHARVKIGISDYVPTRLNSLQSGSADLLTLIAMKPGTEQQEKELHSRFARLRIHHEWFWLQDDLLEYIVSLSDDAKRIVGEADTARHIAIRNTIRENLLEGTQREVAQIIQDTKTQALLVAEQDKLEAKKILTHIRKNAKGLLESETERIISEAQIRARRIIKAAESRACDIVERPQYETIGNIHSKQRAEVVAELKFDCRCIKCGQVADDIFIRTDSNKWCDACWSNRLNNNIYSEIAMQARKMGLGKSG